MRKKFLSIFAVMLFSVLSSVTTPISASNLPNFVDMPDDALTNYETSLDSIMIETVNITDDGGCNLTIDMKAPLGDPLSDLYKRVLNITHLNLNERKQIPNEVLFEPSEPERADNVTHSGFNAEAPSRNPKDEFLWSIRQEQLCCLGIDITNWTAHYVVEADSDLLIHLEAEALLHSTVSDENWTVAIGPRDLDESCARASFVLTKIGLIQQMLEQTEPESAYNRTWETTFILPKYPVNLTNGDELFGKEWTVDFGNGNELYSLVYGVDLVPLRDEVVLLEKMDVTEGSISKTTWQILDEEDFLCYKIFNIKYSQDGYTVGICGSGSTCHGNIGVAEISEDWSKEWSISLWKANFTLQFTYEGVDVVLDVYADLTLSWYVGWDIELSWTGLEVEWFKAWIKLHPYLDVDLNVTFPVEFEHEWSKDLFSWTHRFAFMVGCLPVEADLNFNAGVSIYVNASFTVSIECGVVADGVLKGGVKWDDGFSLIHDVSMDVDKTGPDCSIQQIESWMKPSVTFSLEFMFYSVAGPYVDFTPYAYLHTWYAGGLHWWIKVGLDITVGVRFAGWLEDLLDLPSYDRNILDRVFWNVSDVGELYSDVAVTGVRPSQEGWVGETIPVSVDVLNKGYEVEDVTVDLTYWEGTEWQDTESKSIYNLREGATETLNFVVPASKEMSNGTYNIRADASITTSGHNDQNETDNWDENSTMLKLQNVAVIDVSDPEREETYPESGYYEVTVNVTVNNAGSVDVPALAVSVKYIKDHQLIPVSDVWCENQKWIFNMTPGDVRQKTFTWIQPEEEIDTPLDACVDVLPHEIDTVDNCWVIRSLGHRTVVAQGCQLDIIITIENQNFETQTFHVTLYANTIEIASETVILSMGDSINITFTWNTTGVEYDNYIIWAYVESTGEEDKTLIYGQIKVGIPGDANGDGIVNMIDIYTYGIQNFMEWEDSYGWYHWHGQRGTIPPAINADVDCNGIINMMDIYTAIIHFMHSEP